MEGIVAIMATIILIATLATLIFAFAAYFITKAKKKKQENKIVKTVSTNEMKPVRTYFERYMSKGNKITQSELVKHSGYESNQWM